jgi:FdhD protein
MLDKLPILRVTKKGATQMQDAVVTEFHLTIVLNNRELVTLLCSPEKLEFLAIGFLASESHINISPADVLNLVKTFVERSELFQATGGLHSAALCDTEKILLFSEDIGRHNAIDKVFGECILKDIRTDDRIMITSGRISSEILLKVAKRNIPILISKSPPTNLGVKLAEGVGITLIGFARGERMNIYTNGWRVVSHGR